MRALVVTLCAAWVASPPLAAQQDRAPFAVLPFQNEQSFGLEPEAYAALELSLAQLLASELARSPGGQVADRGRTEAAVGKRSEAPTTSATASDHDDEEPANTAMKHAETCRKLEAAVAAIDSRMRSGYSARESGRLWDRWREAKARLQEADC